MFSISKKITKIQQDFFNSQLINEDQFDIFSHSYSLKFKNIDHNIKFQSGVLFFVCLDKYDGKVQCTFDVASICETHETHVTSFHQNKKTPITQRIESDSTQDNLYFSRKNLINPAYQFDKCTINELLKLLELEVQSAQAEFEDFISEHNIEQNIEEHEFNTMFKNLQKEFTEQMNIENLRAKQPDFLKAEAIHLQLNIEQDSQNTPTSLNPRKVNKF